MHAVVRFRMIMVTGGTKARCVVSDRGPASLRTHSQLVGAGHVGRAASGDDAIEGRRISACTQTQ